MQITETKTIFLEDDASLTQMPSAISHRRWRNLRVSSEELLGDVGVYWRNSEAIDLTAEEIVALVSRPFVALHFPTAVDGRAYSQAQRLRRLGYRGALRATGVVKRDQALFMVRCGFDVLEVSDDPQAVQQAIGQFSAVYQPAADDRPLIR